MMVGDAREAQWEGWKEMTQGANPSAPQGMIASGGGTFAQDQS